MKEPYKLTATEAGKLMKDGSLTVEAYAKSLLLRIRARNDVVKAWAYLDPEFVLEQARRLDRVPEGERGLLHGVAVGVKDVILTKDMPTALNSDIYKNQPAGGIDATCITIVRASGALILGKTTTTEFAAIADGGGPTTNPHDTTRTPGGSSSGSGAAVGDFQVPLALGTQTGGSTLRPGSFNSIYAFKPTWGAISREGLAQFSITCDTLGLYARSVADLQLLAKVFQLADDEAVLATDFGLEGARVAFCRTPVWPRAGAGTRDAWERAWALLRVKGVVVEELMLPEEFGEITKTWHRDVLAGEGRTSFLGHYLIGKDKMHAKIKCHVENMSPKLSRKAQLEAYDGCAKLRPVWDEIASKYDIVITPSVIDEAPVGIGNTGDASFNSMWTILQVPAVNVPGFAGENGMPIGLTLVGPRYHDERVLYVAKAIGEVFETEGGFKSKLF